MKVQWFNDLLVWTDFVTVGPADSLPAVDIRENSPGLVMDAVVVKIPRAGREFGGKLFGRINVEK